MFEMYIETERLIIRSIELGDEKAYAEMAKDGSLTEIGFDESFYERYDWEFYCMAQGDDEPEMTRLYIHR